MASLDIHDGAERPGLAWLAELAHEVRAAASFTEAARAALGGLAEGFGWVAGIVYAADPAGWRVDVALADLWLSQPARLAALGHWAQADGRLGARPGGGARPSAAVDLGLTVSAELVLTADGEPAHLLQFLARRGFRAAAEFAPAAELIVGLLETRLALERARAGAEASERRFLDLAESAIGHYWEMDENLRFTQLAGVEDFSTLPIGGNVVGKLRWELVGADPERDPKWRRHRDDLLARRPIKDFEYGIPFEKGEIRHWRLNGRPVFDAAGDFRGYRGISVDVTARTQAEALLAHAVENLSERFVLWDADDRLVLGNRQFRESYAEMEECARPGTPFVEHVRAGLDAGLYPAAVGREERWLGERLARHADPGRPFELERGEGCWLLISEHRLPEGGLVTLATDITELKRAEAELRRARDQLERRVAERTAELETVNRVLRAEIAERGRVAEALKRSEERFRDYAASSADWFWEMDAELRFTYLSPNVERLLGVKPEWHYGKSREQIFGAEHISESWARHLETLRRREPFRDFVYFRRGDASEVEAKWLSASGVPRFDARGGFLGYRGTGRDVTAAIESERTIRESAEQLRLIADNLPVLIAYVDRDQRHRFVNRVAEQWHGKPAAELIGRTVAESFDAEAYRSMAPRIRAALAGEPVGYEHEINYPDGIQRIVQANYLPDFDEAGRVRGYIVLVVDVTQQRASEAQLRQAQKMEAVGQLTGGIAHDFNNLLTVIQGNLELLTLDQASESPTLRHAQAALRAVEHGALLTQHLLAFARKQSLQPRPTDINALVASFAPILQRTLGEQIDVKVALADDLWPATVDRAQLENVLLNLALNARDAMAEGGRLEIETGYDRISEALAAELDEVRPGAYVTLSIRDNGHGMSAQVLSHAVEPFFTTKDAGRGSGLGLSMVFGFVKQSRGHMSIDSAPGAGTTVRLFLPRADGPPAAEDRPAAPRPSRGSETILLVEDDQRVREYAAGQLRQLGYRVVTAPDGASALAALETGDVAFDLLFTDVMLAGGISGPELAQTARRRQPTLKVLFTSGYGPDTVLARGQLDPTAGLLSKPYSSLTLGRLIRETLSDD